MGAYGVTIAADADSTRRALRIDGVEEVGVPYRWVPDEFVPTTRLAIGVIAMYGMHRLHKTYPKAAKGVIITSIVVTGLVAAHNYRLVNELD